MLESKETPRCPYCAQEWNRDVQEDDDEFVCLHCNKKFRCYEDDVIIYTTARDCTLNGEKHEWEFDYDLTVGIMERCTKCDTGRFVGRKT